MNLLGTVKARDKAFESKYDKYAEHPRFGHRPRRTGLNPDPYDASVNLHYNATNLDEIRRRLLLLTGEDLPNAKQLEPFWPKGLPRISGTAVKAEPAKQNKPTVPVTHYFDVERVCRRCSQPFIFFAEEQKHWYEELGFRLEVDCVLCHPCRKREQSLAAKRAAYERLVKSKSRDWRETLQMVNFAVSLSEEGVFSGRVVERMRAALKSVPAEERDRPSYKNLIARIKAISEQDKK